MAESLTDLMEPRYSPLAKVTKDVAAAGVLLTAVFSVIIGVAVFLPLLLVELPATLDTFMRERLGFFTAYAIVLVMPAAIGVWKGKA